MGECGRRRGLRPQLKGQVCDTGLRLLAPDRTWQVIGASSSAEPWPCSEES